MKRLAAIGLFLLGLGCAGMFSGTVIADITTSTSATTTTGTTTALTTTAATTTAVTTTAPLPGPPPTIPTGVRVGGVKVGGLTPAAAVKAVQTAYSRRLAIVVDRSRLVLEPRLFSSAYVSTAVAKARIAEPRSNVKLVVAVRGANVRSWVARVTKRFSRPSVDATLAFKGERPVIRGDRPGRSLNAKKLTQRIVGELASNSRLAVRVHTVKVAPTVSADAFAHVITINRSSNRLTLYDDGKLRRTFPVATGQAIYPTPRGTFHIVVKYRNPWWYPPTSSSWAQGLKPVPPGPSNPLGTRWMGISSPGVGIHGTDAPASIGYSASHGCVRMQVPDAEWLFDHVDIGTTVHIV